MMGFQCWVLGFGFWVSGFGFRVSGFGFCVLCFGFSGVAFGVWCLVSREWGVVCGLEGCRPRLAWPLISVNESVSAVGRIWYISDSQATFWPWLSGKNPSHDLKCSQFAWLRECLMELQAAFRVVKVIRFNGSGFNVSGVWQ